MVPRAKLKDQRHRKPTNPRADRPVGFVFMGMSRLRSEPDRNVSVQQWPALSITPNSFMTKYASGVGRVDKAYRCYRLQSRLRCRFDGGR